MWILFKIVGYGGEGYNILCAGLEQKIHVLEFYRKFDLFNHDCIDIYFKMLYYSYY